jgi:hypothetical protein
MVGPLGISMDRMGSGTTWIPDAVQLPSKHRMVGSWELMLHGFAFLQNDWQDGPRGDSQVGSLNWAMLMATRELAGGRLQARTMLSLDPWTVTPRGYPLLLQTGETYKGAGLRDRQHPHDFWMELAALYEREVSANLGVSMYAAASGEPALGPVAFMHRPSAMDDPMAPLSHHWHDATHISYGVVTGGIFGRKWKLEGSIFNGREPDEHRWNFDPIRLDSYSGRVTVNPNANWSFTLGAGFLDSPEILHQDESVRRVTASALHGRALASGGQWATSAVWGANFAEGHDERSHAFLLESEAILDGRNTLIGRAEYVQKSASELGITSSTGQLGVGTLSLGYIRELVGLGSTTTGIGFRGTVNFLPASAGSFYGSRTPVGAVLFLRLRPTRTMNHAMPAGHIHDSPSSGGALR